MHCKFAKSLLGALSAKPLSVTDPELVGLLDRLWKAISEALFDDIGGSDAAGTEDARKRAQAMRAGRVAARARPAPARRRSSPRSPATRAPRSGRGSSPARGRRRSTTCRPRRRCCGFSTRAGSARRSYDPAERHRLVRGAVAPAAGRDAGGGPGPACGAARRCSRRAAAIPTGRWWWRRPGCTASIPPGMGHPMPYPYTGGPEDETQRRIAACAAAGARPSAPAVRRACPARRRASCRSTSPCRRTDFRRTTTGSRCCGASCRRPGPSAFEALHRARAEAESDRIRAKARPLIYGYGAAAAGAGAVPLPMVGVGGLAGVIAMTLRTLASRYGVAWTPRHLRPVQRGGRRRRARLVDAAIRPAGDAQARPGGRHRGGRRAQCGGGVRGDRRHRRGRLRMAGLPAPRPDRAQRRGAPRLCGRTCGGAAAGEKSKPPARRPRA